MDWTRINELKDEIGEEDLADILAIFLEEVSERLSQMRVGDAKALADDLHFVKSSALNIGFASLANASAEMETNARDGAVEANISELKAAFDQACATLAESGIPIAAS